MKKSIYKFSTSYGRMGTLEGVFTATKKQIDKLISSKIEVYFGEVLGKHSEVFGVIEKKDIKLVTNDAVAVEIFEKYNFASGHNPFKYASVNFEVAGDDIDNMTVGEIIDKLLD